MLLAVGVAPEEARVAGLDARPNVAHVERAEDVEDLVADPRRAWEAIVMGAGIEDPVHALRRVKARAPHVPVLILSTPERCARVQHELLLTPLPGEPARCVPLGPDAPRAVEAHLVQAKLRRRHSKEIQRANLTSALPYAMETRLPNVVERFFDATPVGILLVDARGQVTYRNRIARTLTPPRRHVVTALDALPGADEAAVARLLDQRTQAPRERLSMDGAKGGRRHFDATAARVQVRQGETLVLVTLDEVTPLVEAEERLEEARLAAMGLDKLASMGSLAAGLAHEIRTPLTAILNNAAMLELLARRAVEQAQPPLRDDLLRLPEHVQGVTEGADRINGLVKDLHRFLRNQAPEKAILPLSEAVSEAVRIFEAAHRGAIRVGVRLSAAGLVLADAAQVQQIALNLLQNAADASPSGATVRVETRDGPSSVDLVVADEGRGIPPEIQGKLYEAFVTTKPDGSGLGLSIVRRLVEVHGARVSFTTGPSGTTFVVSFPKADA